MSWSAHVLVRFIYYTNLLYVGQGNRYYVKPTLFLKKYSIVRTQMSNNWLSVISTHQPVSGFSRRLG